MVLHFDAYHFEVFVRGKRNANLKQFWVGSITLKTLLKTPEKLPVGYKGTFPN